MAAPGGVPAIILRRRVALIAPGLPTLPYHHDTLAMRADEADALIVRVRRSIAACTSQSLTGILNDLAPEYSAVALAIREPPFPRLPESVEAVRQSYQLQCAADGMMYQFALCHAARECGLDVVQCRRGEEFDRAAAQLAVHRRTVESFVGGRGRPSGPPWTKEHRRAYAAALAVLAARAPRRRIQIR